MVGSSQIRQKRLIILITIILLYSAIRVTPNIYSAPTQAHPSPMILKSFGKGQQRSEKDKSIGSDGISEETLKLGG